MSELPHTGRAGVEMVIGGDDVVGTGPTRLPVLDPSTGEQVSELPCATPEEVDRAIEAATGAAGELARSTPQQRIAWLRLLATEVLAHADELADIEVRDVGKVKAEAAAEAHGAATFLTTIADLCETYPWTEKSADGRTTTTWDPVGTVASILPWNAPLAAVARRIGISIATGNPTVIKPSELAPMAAVSMARLTRSSGLPSGAVNAVTGGPEVGRLLVRHPAVKKVAFTGGPAAGSEILRMSAETMRPVAVELGGKSPQVVLDDADIDTCVAGIVRGLTRNAGQVCTTGSRLLVHTSIAAEVLGALTAALGGLRVGSAHDDQTDMGPVISAAHRDRISGFVARAAASGHAVHTPAHAPDGAGFFIAPSIVTGARPGDEIFDDEVFGPVIAVTEFSDDDEAVRLANATRFGLVAAVWTTDAERGEAVAQRIDAGLCWINGYWASPVSTSRLPRKQSGTGWMDFGVGGIREYLLPKAVTRAQ